MIWFCTTPVAILRRISFHPPETEPERAIKKVALRRRVTAMHHRLRHPPNHIRFDRLVPDKVKLAANAAHGSKKRRIVESVTTLQRDAEVRSLRAGDQARTSRRRRAKNKGFRTLQINSQAIKFRESHSNDLIHIIIAISGEPADEANVLL